MAAARLRPPRQALAGDQAAALTQVHGRVAWSGLAAGHDAAAGAAGRALRALAP